MAMAPRTHTPASVDEKRLAVEDAELDARLIEARIRLFKARAELKSLRGKP